MYRVPLIEHRCLSPSMDLFAPAAAAASVLWVAGAYTHELMSGCGEELVMK